MAVSNEEIWLNCPECEAACLDRPLPEGAVLRCNRCGVTVKRPGREAHVLQRAWAFASAGLIFVILANVEPVLTFIVSGNEQSNKISTGVTSLWAQGYWPVAFLVCFSAMLAPFFHLLSVSYVAGGCSLNLRLPLMRRVSKWAELLAPWNLVPVYAVAAMVSVVKLDMLGQVDWEQGALWVVALSLCSLLAEQFFDSDVIEKRLEELHA